MLGVSFCVEHNPVADPEFWKGGAPKRHDDTWHSHSGTEVMSPQKLLQIIIQNVILLSPETSQLEQY